MKKSPFDTPLMRQYTEMKQVHPDAILLFRVGDFYETFAEDAIRAAEVLGITLTRRSEIELAGFPHHALDNYLPKLVRAGLRVAVCEQLEDPKLTKKLVKRGITELVTPGVSINDNVLNHKENNFLAAVHFAKNKVGVAFLDISTGEFLVAEGTADYIDKLLNSFAPKEVLYDRTKRAQFDEVFGTKFLTFEQDDWVFTSDAATDRLLRHFETSNLKGFGVEALEAGIVAAGAIMYYLDHTHHRQVGHITALSRIEEDRFVWLDRFTVRNLELYGSANENARTLANILDRTTSPMGARLLKRWLAFPLKNVKPIEERQSVVEYFFRQPELKREIDQKLALIGDLERIVSKVAVGRVSPREVVQLKTALNALKPIKEIAEQSDNDFLRKMGEQLNPCPSACERIEREVNSDPPVLVNKGGVIRSGVNKELDDLRQISSAGKDYLLQVQQRESQKTGIPSLKVNYNNVFGYYIEVTNAHKNKVPEDWIRKQTLTNAERYITPELKEYEEKILGAEEKILVLETALYNDLVGALLDYIPSIQLNCTLIAQVDCLLSFAKISAENKYIRPVMNDGDAIDIKNGRHPVIEKHLPIGESYIANDVFLDNEQQQIIIITGPNMSGKSALLRQTALIVLMAQIGCFVPAEAATIGVVDKIFVRVGVYAFQSQCNGLVLDVTNGTAGNGANIQMWGSNGTNAQRWTLIATDASSTMDEGSYVIGSKSDSTLSVDIVGASAANGAAAQLYADNGTYAQKYKALSAGGGAYYLVNIGSSKYLDVRLEDTTKLQQWERAGGANQKWILEWAGVDTFTFYIKSVHTGGYLTNNAGNLLLSTKKGTASQQFVFKPTTSFKVYLDAGHGPNGTGKGVFDPGAGGNGQQEYALNKELVEKIAAQLGQRGIAVYVHTDGGNFADRHQEAVSLGCSTVVSIHFNAVGGASGGSESYIHSYNRPIGSVILQDILHAKLVAGVGLADRGEKTASFLITGGRLPS